MKKLIALLLFAVPLWGQNVSETVVRPMVATTTQDSCTLVGDTLKLWTFLAEYDSSLIAAGDDTLYVGDLPLGVSGAYVGQVLTNDTLWTNGWTTITAVVDSITFVTADTALIAGDSVGVTFLTPLSDTLIVAGQKIFGVGLVYNTTVKTKVDSATIVVSVRSTSDGMRAFNFAHYTSHAYQNNDFMGLPFEIANAAAKTLSSVVLVDSSDTGDSLDVILFNDPNYATTPIVDTAQVSFGEEAVDNVLGVVKLRTLTDLGAVRLVQENGLNHVMSNDKVYGRLVLRKTVGQTPTSLQPFVLRFKFVY